jgi:NAD-dependent SIR2 family protein deacetylase
MLSDSLRQLDPISTPDAAETLREWLDAHRRIVVLTGAGISTASGIPDYRGPDGVWKRRAPVTYQQFMRDPAMRARYWARSFVGWPLVARAQPNRAHRALVEIDAQKRIEKLITQNVDGLHTRAGQRDVIDLHGRIDQVICVECGTRVTRAEIQHRLADAHPDWTILTAATAPDGDADLERISFDDFHPPACSQCGGMLKPDVVFFGENVPRERVIATQEALVDADAMLVVGSSLMVYSGFRFARMAHERGLPLAILTRGITRADSIATLKLDADCETTLAGAVADSYA